jgi:hypothetical protein
LPLTSDLNLKELLIYNNDSNLIRYQRHKKEESDKNDSNLLKMNNLVKNLFSHKISKNEKTSESNMKLNTYT